MNQARDAAVVGIYEWPKRVDPDVSAMEIKALSIHRALEDAGLKWSDVDGIYDANDGEGGGGLGLAPYLGLHPRIIDTTSVAGSSYEFQISRALRDIAAGRVNVAVLSYGSKAASQRIPIGTGGPRGAGNWQANMENPYGSTLISNYAMVAMRHMHEYGTTSEQLANIAVTTRAHAMRNPQAVQAMQDLQFMNIREITVDDVMESRVIADPLHLLDCCMVSDGGGALVLANPAIARSTKKKPVWVIGCGEGIQYRRNGGDITVSAAAQSAPRAFAEAQVTPDEIDIAMIYDSFTITVAMLLEDVGFCKKGEAGAFVSDQHLRWDRPGLTINTDGGGLSSNHPGMRGLFLLLEATRQMRGESTSQVPNAKLALAHGNGGLLGGTHTGGTVVLAAD